MNNINNVEKTANAKNKEEIKMNTITEKEMLMYFEHIDTNSIDSLYNFIIINLDFEYDEDATVSDLVFHMEFYGLESLEETRAFYRRQLSDRKQLTNVCYNIINILERNRKRRGYNG